ncbi:Efflux pump periplasmic linker BepF [Eubacteriaceae bacterium CHKCI004]|nr:Efflux pump periplasmic linker BepF [Eubacteriaceae bacterium CHKCI004]
MKNKKKLIIISVIVILVLAAIVAGVVYFVKSRSGSVVDVYSMELLNSSGWAGGDSTLSGTITSDYVQEVYADEEQTVEDVYVQQGDYVEKGDNLMKYDVEEQELDLQLQELEIQSSQLELEDLENELQRMKNARASGTIDGSGSDVMNASLNLSSLRGDILATLMSNNTGAGTSEEDGSGSSETGTAGSGTDSKQSDSGNTASDSVEEDSTDSAGDSSAAEGDTAGNSQDKEGKTDASSSDSKSTSASDNKEGSSADTQENDTSDSSSSDKNKTRSKSKKAKTGEENTEDTTDDSDLLGKVEDLTDAASGDGTEENPYVFNVNTNDVTIKGSLLNQLVGEEEKDVYAFFFQYETEADYNNDAGKKPEDRNNYINQIIITPKKYAAAWSEEDYTFAAVQAAVRDRKLKDTIIAVSDRETGQGTDGAPYVYLLKGTGEDKMIAGSVIFDLLEGNYTAVFKVYESESAYAENSENTSASYVLNPVYDTDGIDQNAVYSIDDLKTIFSDKKLKSKIETISDNTYGDGSANDPYIYLLSQGGTVRGSVVQLLVKGEYYAEFQEFESEESYKDSPYSSSQSVSITPGMPITGIESTREYTLQQLQAALNAAEAASRIPNVLKSEITDKKNDAYKGSGTMSDPYVYRLITDGRIRGSVINDIMKNNEFAVFYEYDSEEDGRRENVANSIEIRPNTILKEIITSFGWYTLADLNDAIVTADQIQIRPNRKTVKTGKSYNFTAKLSGKNSEVLPVTWELKRNQSDATTLINGTLTVGEDETADTLRIVASAGGKRDVLTLKVKQSDTSGSDGSGSGGSSDGSSGYDSSFDSGSDSGGSIDYSGYTAEELASAIADKEEEIADAKQNLNQAKIDYQEAKKEVDAATVKATVSGEVTLAYTKEAMPDDGSPAIIVRGEDGMYVNVDVSEMSLDTVKVGGTIYCTSMETYEQYEAEIIEISQYPTTGSDSEYSYDGLSNPNSSYYPVVAYIAQADGLVTGESVEVSYSSQSMGTVSEEAIYLQKAYIRTDDEGKSYVYKEGEDGRLKKQYVKTGETLYGQYVEVLSGVTMDDNIAFPYGSSVKEGAKVELSENTDNIIY